MLKEKQRLKFEKDQIQLENEREADRDKLAEWAHLNVFFHEKSVMYDKQLFYYNISIVTVMILVINKAIEYHYSNIERLCIFLIPLLVIFLSALSTIKLMKTLDSTRNILSYQMQYIYSEDKNEIQDCIDQLGREDDKNNIAFRLFLFAGSIALIYILFGSLYISFNLDKLKKAEDSKSQVINNYMSFGTKTLQEQMHEIKSFTPLFTPSMMQNSLTQKQVALQDSSTQTNQSTPTTQTSANTTTNQPTK